MSGSIFLMARDEGGKILQRLQVPICHIHLTHSAFKEQIMISMHLPTEDKLITINSYLDCCSIQNNTITGLVIDAV